MSLKIRLARGGGPRLTPAAGASERAYMGAWVALVPPSKGDRMAEGRGWWVGWG